ncbi:hypothetical protein MNV49_001795 [Pseudohyphozyma bogoriensis]|nr:hypothetical protein MNV49_001795 [Pseudohyphozyma bogoriensis]
MEYHAVEGTRRPNSPVDPGPGPSRPAETQSPATNRPPRDPKGNYFGPYLQFITTNPANKVWYGSALVFHRKECPAPKLSFDRDLFDTQSDEAKPDTLMEDVFGFVAVRHQLSFKMSDGTGDDKITWTLEGQDEKEAGSFVIPHWDQAWRGGFFSCGGFDGYVPEGVVKEFGFDSVWRHMNSVHEQTPFHLMVYGGDQIYIDNIFEDIPFLKRWIEMPFEGVKWKHEFSEETAKYCASYYFFSYFETWERKECKKALRTCPALMTWDDHDIFDGAGSYPDELRTSPVMSGLFETAYTFRLLFQHHTNRKLCNTKHKLWGVKAQNHIAQLGPRVALFMPDGRTERSEAYVHDPRSMDMAFERLNGDGIADTTQQLLVAFAVPFSFIRVPAAEAMFEFLKNRAPWVRRLPGIKGTNSIFGLPEFYDDLLDEWTHDKHIKERNSVLVRFQKLAAARSIRVTFLSGDVHCAGFARFRSDKAMRKAKELVPATDPNLMYQAIASAIVNASPSPNACIGYHYVKNDWKPVPHTEESMVEMFERRPEGGKHVRHRKFMPNRNWLYFETVGSTSVSATHGATNYVVSDDDANGEKKDGHHHHHHHLFKRQKDLSMLDFARNHYSFDRGTGYPSTLGPTSLPDGTGCEGRPNHEHHHGLFCHHKRSKAVQKVMSAGDGDADGGEKVGAAPEAPLRDSAGIRLRIWLESRKKESEGRQFSSYEMVVPELMVGDRARK